MPTSVDVKNLKINKLTEAQYDTAVQGGVIGENELSILTDAELEQIQRASLPTASADELGKIYQYIGATDSTYTNAYFYKCVSDGQVPATYSWTQVDVQPAGSSLPDQTGQSGKFLTTNGTDASWSDKPLQNTTSEIYSLQVTLSAPNRTIGAASTVFGDFYNVATGCTGAVGVGAALGLAQYCTVIGNSARQTSGTYGTAIGKSARVGANYAIQLGADNTNNDANTFKVGNSNGNFEMMSADGTIPTARLTKVNTTVTLAAADWSSNSQTVTVNGVSSSSVVLVAPDPSDTTDYVAAGILCVSQATNSLTFNATTTPISDIDVNVICL